MNTGRYLRIGYLGVFRRCEMRAGFILISLPYCFLEQTNGIIIIIIIIIIILLDLLAKFRPRTINKLSEGNSDARGSGG